MTKHIKKQKKGEITNKSGNMNLEKFFYFITKGITPYLIIAAIIFGIYSQTLSYSNTGLDDDIILKNANSVITNNNVLIAFKTDASLSKQGNEFYRPIQGLSFIIDAEIGNTNHMVSHISNLFIHIIVCCLLFYLLTILNYNKNTSFFLTLIFSVHPLFNQAVIWLPSRGDLLVTMFSLISFITYIQFSKNKNYLMFFLNIITFFLAVFSKEIAILLPIIFILYDFLNKHNLRKTLYSTNLFFIITWCLIIISYLVMRANIVNVHLKPEQFGIGAFLYNLPVIPEFISKFFIPFNLSVLPEFNIVLISIGLIIITGILFYGIKNKNIFEGNSYLFLIWFIIFTLTPMFYRHEHLGYSYDYLEHRAYMPLIGLMIFISSIKYNLGNIKIMYLLFITILIIFSSFTIVRSPIFKDTISFYSSAIDNATTVSLAYYNRAVIKKESGDNIGAKADYLRAIELKPDYIKAIYNLGIICKDIGDYKGAIKFYDRAIISDPNYPEAYNNRGIIKENLGDNEGAKKDYKRAIELKPKYHEAFNNLGLLMNKLGDLDGAIKDYNEAIKINPYYADAYLNRGEIYLKSNNFISATNDFKKSLELKSNYDKALNSLGVLNGMQNNFKEASGYFEKALQINPNYIDALKNLGLAKLNLKDMTGACEAWRKGAALGNNDCKALYEKFCK